MASPAPSTILGQYRLVSLLGEGGMATVYRAVPTDGGREVAVKLLDQAGQVAETARQRFLREIFTLATLSHPHIVPVVDYGEAQGILYYVMPWLRSGTLESKLSGGKKLGPAEVIGLCEDLLEALRYLHSRGFLHRDIKPGNIMFDDAGRAVLMDFGLVRPEKGSNLTRTGRVIGTPRYIPPEMLKSGDVDETSDLYQLGVVGYQAATASFPYDEEAMLGFFVEESKVPAPAAPMRLNPLIPEPLSNFLLNAVEWRRELRYDGATAMLEDLGRAKAGSPVSRRKPSGAVSRAVRILKPGAIGGRYELLQSGRAAPGVDYLEGKDLSGVPVYLRPLPPLAGTEADALRVLAAHAGVQHPALVHIRDLAVQANQPFLVFERPEGFRFLEPPTGHDALPRERAARQVLDILSGLEALHSRGLIHGEVSLGNVVVGPGDATRLLGLGAHPLRQAGLLERPPGDSTARINTWMAPEQHEGEPPSAAADVYAAGRLLSLLVHGRLLPAAPGAPADGGGDELARILARATAWSAAERYADARQFAADLRKLLPAGQRPASSARVRRAAPGARPSLGSVTPAQRRTPLWAGLAVLAAAAIAALIFLR